MGTLWEGLQIPVLTIRAHRGHSLRRAQPSCSQWAGSCNPAPISPVLVSRHCGHKAASCLEPSGINILKRFSAWPLYLSHLGLCDGSAETRLSIALCTEVLYTLSTSHFSRHAERHAILRVEGSGSPLGDRMSMLPKT